LAEGFKGGTQMAIGEGMKTNITVQFEMTTARRGQMTTTIKERTFPSEAALDRWTEKMAGNVTILRYLDARTQEQEAR
jgi:hypothetical protein